MSLRHKLDALFAEALSEDGWLGHDPTPEDMTDRALAMIREAGWGPPITYRGIRPRCLETEPDEECVVCGATVCTSEGCRAHPEGCQLDSYDWVCSEECWEIVPHNKCDECGFAHMPAAEGPCPHCEDDP